MADNIGVRVMAVAGSYRKESLNRKLLRHGVDALQRAGASVDLVDLNDFAMPIYSEDIEDQGFPEAVKAFKRRIAGADGLLFAVPEYNSSIPGGFKNVLDWASRGANDVLRGKVGAIMSASPGGFGGIRMNSHMRQVMRALGILAIHEQVTLPRAHEVFGEDGSLASPHVARQVDELARALVNEIKLRKLGAEQLRLTPVPEEPAIAESGQPGAGPAS